MAGFAGVAVAGDDADGGELLFCVVVFSDSVFELVSDYEFPWVGFGYLLGQDELFWGYAAGIVDLVFGGGEFVWDWGGFGGDLGLPGDVEADGGCGDFLGDYGGLFSGDAGEAAFELPAGFGDGGGLPGKVSSEVGEG